MTPEVNGYFSDQRFDLFGHTVKRAAVSAEEGQVVLKYECQECDILSNSVAAFDQNECR